MQKLNRWHVLSRFNLELLNLDDQKIIIDEINLELEEHFKKGYSKYLIIGLVSRKLQIAKSIILTEFEKSYKCVRKKNYSTRFFVEKKDINL